MPNPAFGAVSFELAPNDSPPKSGPASVDIESVDSETIGCAGVVGAEENAEVVPKPEGPAFANALYSPVLFWPKAVFDCPNAEPGDCPNADPDAGPKAEGCANAG